MKSDVELVLDAQATIGEGAVWDEREQVLWWVDIPECKLHCFHPADGSNETWNVGQKVGTVVVREVGGLMLAVQAGFAEFDPASGLLTVVHDPEADLPDNRFNDGKCDPAGRFWAGTMDDKEHRTAGSLYSLDADHKCAKHFDGISISNGLAWSSDQQSMYYIDSPTRRIDAFDFDNRAGTIANRRTVVEVAEGMGNPDGMTIDVDDNLWVALWGGFGVAQYDPRTGELLQKIDVPASNVTTCAFGGRDFEDLYITSARERLEQSGVREQPQAGGIFHIRPGVRGRAATRYQA